MDGEMVELEVIPAGTARNDVGALTRLRAELRGERLAVREAPQVLEPGAKGFSEVLLVVAVHVGTAAVLDLARVLLGWLSRRPGTIIQIRSRSTEREVTLQYETRLVTHEQIDEVATALRTLAWSSCALPVVGAPHEGRRGPGEAPTAQGLTGEEQEELCEALIDAFRSVGEMERLVRFGLDESLEALVGGGDLSTIVFRLTEQTESRGWTNELVTAALAERPGNRKLQAFVARRGWPPALLEDQADGVSHRGARRS